MITDKNFIVELKRRNIKALDYLVDNYSDLIYKVSYSVLNNRNLTEECLNDVLLKVWNCIGTFKSNDDRFKKWVIVTSKYTAIDMLRKEIKHENNISLDNVINIKGESIEEEVEAKEVESIIKSEVSKMDDKSQEVFNRRYVKGEKIKEIGANMNLTERAVISRLYRGKKKLRYVLKKGEL